MDLRIFTEPQQGASYADLLGVARATRDTAPLDVVHHQLRALLRGAKPKGRNRR